MRQKSIWDKWKEQLFGDWGKAGGPACALGFIGGSLGHDETLERVSTYIKTHYDMPWGHMDRWGNPLNNNSVEIIIYANNVLTLKPAKFRQIDRLTAVEKGRKG